MKKINKLTAALASLALVAAAFTGCASSHPDAEVALTPGYIAGGFTNYVTVKDKDVVQVADNYFAPITYDDEGVGKLSFTYDSSKAKWGEANGTISFKLTLVSDWSVQWGDVTAAVADDYAALTCPPSNNINVSGLVNGKDYAIYVKPEGATVSVKVVSEYTPATLYLLDTTEGLISIPYVAGTGYKYTFTAPAASVNLPIFGTDQEKYFVAEITPSDTTATDVTFSSDADTLDITGLTAGAEYVLTIVYDKDEPTVATVKVERALQKVFLAGQDPLNWSLTDKDNAIQMNIVGTSCKYYYYTFEAASTSLEFKVATANDWGLAYTNCSTNGGDPETVLDAAPVDYSYANAQNAKVSGLTVGSKYTILVNLETLTCPKVSVITGDTVFFAIGNDDFGAWSWDNCKMMFPTDNADEVCYNFVATKAEAQFKFQTTCAGWNDANTWNAKKALTLGGDYVAMENGPGGDNTSATLTVGTEYNLFVKKTTSGYSVKIAAAN